MDNSNRKTPIKIICVAGASASAIGKGITVSSIASLLKAAGHVITVIKIDPYLNIDAGTMSPYEHGEVFVLDDGGEADLDLGNYERFMDLNLTASHNITTGKIYQQVLEHERRGKYLGKTVQIVPHVTNAIQDWILQIVDVPTDDAFRKPEICVIELGGTVGDIESSIFLEALRQLQNRIGTENMAICLVTFVPVFGSNGEPKTKPSQHGFKELRLAGLTPDFIIARSMDPLEKSLLEKLELFSGVPIQRVINIPELDSVYKVPLKLNDMKIVDQLSARLKIPLRPVDMTFWNNYYKQSNFVKSLTVVTNIAFVGKYVELEDAYISVLKAFDQASVLTGVKIKLHFIESTDLEEAPTDHENKEGFLKKQAEKWDLIKNADGIFVPGGFGFRGTKGKLAAIQYARENKIPFFGVCYGFQLAVVEFCKNVLKWNAVSEEYLDEYTKTPDLKQVICFMPEVKKDFLGGTMRVGLKRALIDQKTSLAFKIYGSHIIYERHRHRYEVQPKYIQDIQAAGLYFSSTDETRCRMEMLEINDHPFYFATQFHPELKGRLRRPSPPFVAFVLAAGKRFEPKEKYKTGVMDYLRETGAFDKIGDKPHPEEQKTEAEGNISDSQLESLSK